MLDQQDPHQRKHAPGWCFPLMCLGVVLLISGWLDASTVHRSGNTTITLVLLGGQLLVNSIFALLMYQRRHLVLSRLAYISFGICLVWRCLLISWRK